MFYIFFKYMNWHECLSSLNDNVEMILYIILRFSKWLLAVNCFTCISKCFKHTCIQDGTKLTKMSIKLRIKWKICRRDNNSTKMQNTVQSHQWGFDGSSIDSFYKMRTLCVQIRMTEKKHCQMTIYQKR